MSDRFTDWWENNEGAHWIMHEESAVKAFEAAQPKWQRIETAPKDGGELLLCYNDHYSPFKGNWSENREHWAIEIGCDLQMIEPAYWQPLPEPPKHK